MCDLITYFSPNRRAGFHPYVTHKLGRTYIWRAIVEFEAWQKLPNLGNSALAPVHNDGWAIRR